MAQRSRKRGRRPKARPAQAKAGPAQAKAGPAHATAKARRAQAKAGGPTPGPAEPAARNPGPGDSPGTIGGWKVEPPMTRSQRRDAAIRAGLSPLRTGERPVAIIVASVVAALLGLGNLIAYAAGTTIGGRHPAAGGIILFSALMLVCAAGMWRLWYGAVLGFMALLAIVATLFALLLIEASNLLGVVVGLLVIVSAGWLFFKLVRVLSRIQMPRPPSR